MVAQGNALNQFTQYWWKVRAANDGGVVSYWSYIRNFTTTGNLPAPNLTEPTNASFDVFTSPKLFWESVPFASSYKLQVASDSDFSNLQLDIPYVSSTSYQVNSLLPNHQYFWRVRDVNSCSTSPWSSVFSFVTGNFIPIGTETNHTNYYWEYPSPYPNFYKKTNIQFLFSAAELTAAGASAGDITSISWNVFSVNNNDGMTNYSISLRHYNETEFTEVYSSSYYTPVTGWNTHNFTTPFTWDGVNNIFVKVCVNDTNYTGNASVYYSTTPFTSCIYAYSDINSDICTTPGFYNFTTMSRPNTLFGFNSDTLNAIQNFNLPAGWNMISANVTPTNPNLNAIFNGETGNVIILKNGDGQNYIPSQGINQIGNWNVLDGYQIKLNAATQFSIPGLRVIPDSTPIPLTNSWNLISYLRSTSMPIGTALSGLGTTLVIAKNGVGQVYVPAYGINQIGNMNPGDGYYIYVNTNEQLLYPANGLFKQLMVEDQTQEPRYLKPDYTNTGNNSSLIVTMSDRDNGKEIGIYTINNKLIGSGVVNKEKAAITIWGDDETTTLIEGAIDNEILSAKILDTLTMNISELSLTKIHDIINNTEYSNLVYHANSLISASGEASGGVPYVFDVTINPDPFFGETNIDLAITEKGEVAMDLYSLDGRMVDHIYSGTPQMLLTRIPYNSGLLPAGFYELFVKYNSQVITKVMILYK
jgi:hypothetical protein